MSRMASPALIARAARLSSVLRETRSRQGHLAAAQLFLRLLRAKLPLLWRQMVTAPGARAVRRQLRTHRASRDALGLVTPRLAIAVTGGIGDFVVIARFLRDLSDSCGGFECDVYSAVPRQAEWVFAAVPGFGRAYHDVMFDSVLASYEVGLRLNQLAVVYEPNVDWRTLRMRPALAQAIAALRSYRPKIEIFAAHHPFLDNFLAQTAVFAGQTRRNFLHHMAGLSYSGDNLAIPADAGAVARFGLMPGGYVTVHNGFDTGFVIVGSRATKCYPHFGPVVERLRAALPRMRFVQVGIGTSERLPQCDLDLLGRTSLPEVAGLLAGAAFHLDNESGLVHLARCYGVRSAVVFGPTPADYFAYPDNVSITPPVCGGCWWLSRTWMDTCAKGYREPRCMTEQEPAQVARQILHAVDAGRLLADAAGQPELRRTHA